jgi:hypothetical protein
VLEEKEELSEDSVVILRFPLGSESEDYLTEQEARRQELLEQIRKGEFEKP